MIQDIIIRLSNIIIKDVFMSIGPHLQKAWFESLDMDWDFSTVEPKINSKS